MFPFSIEKQRHSMLVLGLEMELLTLISLTLMIMVLITWLLREWSWYSYQYKTQQNILGLQEANENLYLRLQIEEAAQPQCASNLTEYSNTTTTFNSFSPDTNISNALIYPAPVFFDLSGLLQLVIFTGLILFEHYFLHMPHLSLAGDNPTEQGIKREVQDFLLKKHPMSNILVFAAVAFLSMLAWWNLLPRVTFLDICFKVLMALAVSSPIAFVTHNLLRVKQYFPTDKDAWQKAVQDYSWWIWLFTRLIGAYDMRSSTKTALWLFCVAWYVWPVRYFFYYRHISCTPTDSIQGCIHTVGVSDTCNSNVNELFETNNVFYINMLGQGALLMICCNMAYLLTMLKALNIPHCEGRDANKKKQDSTYKTGMGIDSTQYGLIGSLLRRLDAANALALLSLFSLLNSLLAVLRVLWFAVFTTCSWYAVMVAFMFIHMHLGVTMYALPSVNALMQKYSTIDTYRDVFVQQFREHQQEQRAAEHDTHNNVHNHASDPRQPQAEQEAGSHNHSSEKNGEAPSSSSTKGTPTGGSPDTPCSGEEAESGKAEINQNSEASASENKTSGYSISDAEEDDFTAQEVFNKVLTDSVLYYLFVGTSVKGSDDTSSGKEGKDGNQEDAGSKLSVIFQAFLQTAAYSYQNQSSAQGDDDEGGDEGEGAGGQSSRGSAAREGAKRAQPPKFDRHDHYD